MKTKGREDRRQTRATVAAALALPVVLAVALLGCGQPNPEQVLADSRRAVAASDFVAAQISLKTLLQSQPDLPEARFLLGMTLLGQEQAEAAAIEFRKAITLGYPGEEVRIMLARALLASRQTKAVIDEFGDAQAGTPQERAALMAVVAAALSAEGRFAEAWPVVQAALALDAEHVPALLLHARLAAARGQPDAAFGSVERALQLRPNERDSMQLKAELLWRLRGDTAAARALLEKGAATYPDHIPTLGLLLSLLSQLGDTAGMTRYVDQLAQRHPGHAESALWQARTALRAGQLDQARALAQGLLKFIPDNALALELAGTVELARGASASAEPLLSKALQVQPSLLAARLALAESFRRSGQPARSLSTLDPLLRLESPPAEALAAAGHALLATGQFAEASRRFARASELAPADPALGTLSAVSAIAAGDRAAGLARLEAISASSIDTAADLALFSARLAAGDAAGARTALDRAIQKDPKPTTALFYRAEIHLRSGAVDAARADLERASSLDSGFLDAVIGLALLDAGQGRFTEAIQRLRDHGTRHPAQARSRVVLADLLLNSGAEPGAVAAALNEGIQADPADGAVRRRLVMHLLGQGQVQAAKQAAQEAASALPDRPDVLDTLAVALIASGDGQQALTALNRVTSLVPGAPEPLVRLGDAHMELKDYGAAEAAFRRAAAVAPGFPPAHRGLIQAALLQNKGDQAVEWTRQLQRLRPNDAIGLVLESEVQAVLKRWPAAVAAGRKAFTQSRNSETAVRLHALLLEAGQRGEAEGHATEWLRANPDDHAFLSHLASQALQAGRLDEAERLYARILGRVANDPAALNNVAWIRVLRKQPDAVPAAERAVAAAPDSAAALDTLAAALALAGQMPKALETQRRALRLAPNAPILDLHLAKLLIQADQKAEAKAVLERLRKLGGRFDRQPEVTELLAKL